MLDATDDPLVGTDLGAYRLVRVLGEGGMGRVYAAVHPGSGSRVAIKLIAERFAKDKDLLGRFFAEARAVNLIRHENIVNIVDLVELPDGRPFIVMELVTGQTLRQLGQAKSPMGGIINVMNEVLAGLAAAHAIGIVHRDLKPDNILVTTNGHAKLLDFGIAKLSHSLPNAPSLRTQTGVVLGTPEYMAPEMVVGDPVDGRADLYAIGLILYELLAGRRPFAGGTDFDTMRAHVEAPVIPPRQWRPEIPESLEAIVMRALAKRPADRFESALAMQKALRRAAVELLGDGQWKPMLGGWLAPAAMTESLSSPTRQQAATVRERRRAPPQPPAKRKRVHVVVPVVVAVAACTSIALVIAMRDEAPAPPADAAAPVIAGDALALVASSADAQVTSDASESSVSDAAAPPRVDKRADKPVDKPVEQHEERVELGPATPLDVRWRAALPKAHNIAYRALRDAALVEILFPHVDPDGQIPGWEHIRFRYRGPNVTGACSVQVDLASNGEFGRSTWGDTADCKRPPVRTPRCGLAKVRAKLRARDPELAKRTLDVIYRDDRWFIGGTTIADDCGKVTIVPVQEPRIVAHDPQRFDWRAYLSVAKQRAKAVAPDAKLVAIVLDPVAPDGTIDLTSGGPTRYVFRSSERTMAGGDCTITVNVTKTIDVKVDNLGCIAPFTTDPSCSAKQVLEQLTAVGAPPRQLRFQSGTWHAGKERVADRCP